MKYDYDENNDKTNQDGTIDTTDAETNASAVFKFDRQKLRNMLNELEKMINSSDGAKRLDKRSIAHDMKNIVQEIINMISTWVSDGTEILTKDESSSEYDGDEESLGKCLTNYEKLKKWVKKLKSLTLSMNFDSNDTESSSSSDDDAGKSDTKSSLNPDDDADDPSPGKRARLI